MSLFEGNRRKPGTRSNTKLIVSGGDSPAEHWKVKQDLPKLFDYPYGGVGQTDIIVSKGMFVSIDAEKPLIREYTNNRYLTQITIADGTNSVIGMTPYNLAREVDDRFTGNQPSIITKEYVELPYFPNADDAANNLWGNCSGDIKPGDLVKVSKNPLLKGRVEKWVEGTDPFSQICGQVLAKEPSGSDYDFLEWVMWDERYKYEEDAYVNKSGYSAPGLDGYPFDPEMYDKNAFSRDAEGFLSEYTTTATGITGLTDGSNARNTALVRNLGLIADGTAKDTVVSFYVQKELIRGEVSISIDSVKILENDPNLTIDYKKGFIKYKVPTAVTKDQVVTATYKAYQYGTPSHMDFNGVDGVVRILLRF